MSNKNICFKKKETVNYLLFWFGQMISQLGSALTSFALTIWAYQKTGRAMTVSLLTFCSYLPLILASTVSGGIVDRCSKKAVMLICDTVAACCTLTILFFTAKGSLGIGLIYGVNVVIGLMNAFQSPASSVAVGQLAPDGQYERVSGLNSFSSNLVTVAAPMLAGVLLAAGGLSLILAIDLGSFLFAAATLLFVVRFPGEDHTEQSKTGKKGEWKKTLFRSPFRGFAEGLDYLKVQRGMLYLMLIMALINFFSRLTYENILPAMILARSGSSSAYGIVSGVLGIGGILGGLLVTVGGKRLKLRTQVFGSVMISFLAGDLLMGMGRDLPVWCIAGLAASVPIPFIMAGQHALIYRIVPENMQGRIFAVQSIVQFSSIPVGILLGGVLADYVMEPFMQSGSGLAVFLSRLVGSGAGSGMAVMFLCSAVLGSISGALGYRSRKIRDVFGLAEEKKSK